MPQISVIAAVSINGIIGINNTLPWHLPEDLQRFKALTMGHHIIMGRKTYESLGRLLPGRTTVIVTRNPHYAVEGAKVAQSLEGAIKLCAPDTELFIIGGAELYQQGLVLADTLYLTEIQQAFAGDAVFPALNMQEWQETSREQHVSKTGLAFAYVTYRKR